MKDVEWKHFGTIGKKLIQAASESAWYYSYNPTFWVGMYVLARFGGSLLSEFRSILFSKGSALLRRGISEITMSHI